MIEVIAILLLLATAGAWLWVATPQLVDTWIGFARELDPTKAAQHAALFSPPPRPLP